MKAIEYKKYGSPEVLEINEVDKPVPKLNEVLIKIEAATVSAVDSIFRRGNHFFARLATGLTKPKQSILGTDFTGTIESLGENVTKFKVGDNVFGSSDNKGGTHAQYICLPENGAYIPAPDKLTKVELAAVPYGALTALPFIRDAGKINGSKKILIIGASGSVGLFAVQFAKHFGAEVTGVCSSSNAALVNSMGADFVIDYQHEDFSVSDKQYDVIFDVVGKSSFGSCKNILTANGLYMTAVISFSILFRMLVTSIFDKKKATIAFTGLRKTEEKLKDLNIIRELLIEGKIKPVVDKVYKFEEYKTAHSYVDTGHKKGDVVLRIN